MNYTVRAHANGTVGVFEGDQELWFCRREELAGMLARQESLAEGHREKLPSGAAAALWCWLVQG